MLWTFSKKLWKEFTVHCSPLRSPDNATWRTPPIILARECSRVKSFVHVTLCVVIHIYRFVNSDYISMPPEWSSCVEYSTYSPCWRRRSHAGICEERVGQNSKLCILFCDGLLYVVGVERSGAETSLIRSKIMSVIAFATGGNIEIRPQSSGVCLSSRS